MCVLPQVEQFCLRNPKLRKCKCFYALLVMCPFRNRFKKEYSPHSCNDQQVLCKGFYCRRKNCTLCKAEMYKLYKKMQILLREKIGVLTVRPEKNRCTYKKFWKYIRAKLKCDVLTNWQSGYKMFLAAITPPIYWRISFDPPCPSRNKLWFRQYVGVGADVLFPPITTYSLWRKISTVKNSKRSAYSLRHPPA